VSGCTPSTIEAAAVDQWAIADALLEEIGAPSSRGGTGDGSGQKFKDCAKELADQGHVGSHGKAWSAETLRRYRDVAAAYPNGRRLPLGSWSVHATAFEVGASSDLLPLLQSCVDGARPRTLLPPLVPQVSYQGTYRDLPWIIQHRGRVAVNDVMLASGRRRMHEGGSGKKKKKTQPEDVVQLQADQVEDLLDDPEVRERVKEDLASLKGARKAASVAKAWQVEAERAAVEAEREEQRLAEAARKQIGKAREYWPELHRQLDAFTKLIAVYFREFDDLPSPESYELRLLDGAFESLRTAIDRFDKKLHPGGKNRLRQGKVIDLATEAR
jgi:hypothetical protein